ncbi:MipA/OmpV family protein [Sphingopyxis sp. KK2]|uniref:MipA/OmpV family protein n=1 Tax=Sphingopyxis sp. KK2 TaxID=1855727 RepID=UPI00097E6BD7|nr:MipA/OmpV family protein [Sphingopyxis sp. KK2]
MAIRHILLVALPLLFATVPAQAQDEDEAPKRTRLILGPQLSPSWPGADKYSIGPYVDLSRERVGTEFTFEAADESFGAPLITSGKFAFGPAFGFVGKRTAADVGANLPKVGLTIEAGGFAQVSPTPSFRLRAEARRGLGGHDGFVGEVSADYIARDGDDWLFSIGPRVTLGDGKYQRAYFGVSPAAAAASGLPAHDIDGGVHAVGLTAGYLRQLTPSWGFAVYGRYDRLVGDAARSPIVRQLGSRNQPSVGVALSYTFGGGR